MGKLGGGGGQQSARGTTAAADWDRRREESRKGVEALGDACLELYGAVVEKARPARWTAVRGHAPPAALFVEDALAGDPVAGVRAQKAPERRRVAQRARERRRGVVRHVRGADPLVQVRGLGCEARAGGKRLRALPREARVAAGGAHAEGGVVGGVAAVGAGEATVGRGGAEGEGETENGQRNGTKAERGEQQRAPR